MIDYAGQPAQKKRRNTMVAERPPLLHEEEKTKKNNNHHNNKKRRQHGEVVFPLSFPVFLRSEVRFAQLLHVMASCGLGEAGASEQVLRHALGGRTLGTGGTSGAPSRAKRGVMARLAPGYANFALLGSSFSFLGCFSSRRAKKYGVCLCSVPIFSRRQTRGRLARKHFSTGAHPAAETPFYIAAASVSARGDAQCVWSHESSISSSYFPLELRRAISHESGLRKLHCSRLLRASCSLQAAARKRFAHVPCASWSVQVALRLLCASCSAQVL